MRALRNGTRAWLLSSALLFSPLLVANADAAQHRRSGRLPSHTSFHVYPASFRQGSSVRLSHGLYVSRGFDRELSRGFHRELSRGFHRELSRGFDRELSRGFDRVLSRGFHHGGVRYAMRSYGISCVPYARQASGIMVPGNAWQWWENAEGMYARGDRPEPGSVLNFRANGRMRLGHVAVVTEVVNAREIIVDQANWPSAGSGWGGVSHNVEVVDVSEANNWSAVRVELGRGGDFGSVYPTYGFIYNRPDTGFVTASVNRPAPQPEINRVPSDLRPVAERPWRTAEEVAEAPARPLHRIDLSFSSVPFSYGR
jgi:surface antigen